jgi:ATP-binding cassette subfamily C (CFTR/MRP) protein 4
VTIGALAWKTYLTYFRTGGGVLGTLLFFTILVISQVFIASADYWISYWASAEGVDFSDKSRQFETNLTNASVLTGVPAFAYRARNYYIYLGLILAGIASVSLRSLCFYTICLRASKKLHYKMFNSVMSAPVRFFDLNPLGRIINRFSKDVGLLDEQIPWAVYDFLEVSAVFGYFPGCYWLSMVKLSGGIEANVCCCS